ncbi:hypothetical protein BH20ACT2_BH20ACT2_13510 [soil metagenome]
MAPVDPDRRRSPRRWLGGRLPGADVRRRQVIDYAAAWAEVDRAARAASGPRWVVLGDSVSVGVGASRHDRGYVGLVLDRLRAERDPGWVVVNRSVTGARTADVLTGQLAVLDELDRVELVSCAIGGNDLLRSRWATHRAALERLLDALPAGAVVATLPRGLRERQAMAANALIEAKAAERGLVVADVWSHTGPPWAGRYAADHFHPSDTGHKDWADAFTAALGLG